MRKYGAMSAVTMTTVAHEAGVSVTTVSHVVNGTRPVASPTRERVLEAMKRLGYTHHRVARSLAAGTTLTIGIALPASVNPFLHELRAGIEGEALRQGLSVLASDTGENDQREERAVANLLAHHINGIVLVPTAGWQNGALRILREHPVPFVVVDRLQPMRIDQVGVENEACAMTLVDHLLTLGHRRIGIIAGLKGLSTTAERLNGYLLAHHRRNVPVDRALIVDGGSTEMQGRRAMRQLLALQDRRPTAVFVANDSMTLGALRALGEERIAVPRDLALVSFDDLPWADIVEPRITGVAQPSFAMGARAVQLLHRRMMDSTVEPQTLRLTSEIAHRSSCGCADR